ncbi:MULTISPECIES: DHA2 family efflux MFS transporter permease subunit [Paenibacillus]|uniref:DHA2 family efflux MFS transporter permease subunit n=1 Tax=Paenibacillus TaxID=44249 RepID=UPI00020D7EAA|nr:MULTISPECIES: DHA2 family efflux MFS transporter permease subunit [Paenibacillus]EGL19032.1 drug resistance MFS transporter, drug:H+ antiporter-2 family [Paenibacillus sp. HGF7]EPD81127.1 drug:H+ antiporter-2 (14 Spanner) (DHA2) family drug resistance MFS transporter [Paenibacillus sp. HGH0039]MBV6715014.1 DHA2 family efflux MFS transporter permease subunit [Paenibacillus chitinolyticus]
MSETKALVVYKEKEPEEDMTKHRGTVLLVLILGAFVTILNQTLLNVALPHLMNDFNASADTIQWLSTGYMLINGIIIPISAFLIGTFTTRQLFISAMISFTVGSLICGMAPNFTIMMIGRIVQGAGAGIIMPLMMTVILNIYPPQVRGRAMGTIGIAMFFAPAVGPTLSGWIIEHWTWRILFYVAMPIAIVDIIFAFFVLKNVTKVTKPAFDFLGFVTSTIGFGSLLYGISEAGSKGWDSVPVVSTIIIGVVFIALFIVRELTAKNPLLNLRVFKYNMFSLSTVVSCIVNMAMFGASILVPIYVQNIRGYSPMEAGLLMLPGALLMGVMSPISGALFDRFGIKPLAFIGLTITAITTWQFAHLNADTTYSTLMWLYTIRMFGMSFIAMTIMTTGLNQLPRELASHGTAASNTARQIASSIGTAILVTIMTNRTTYHVGQYANDLSLSNPNYNPSGLDSMGAAFAQQMGQSLAAGKAYASQVLYGLVTKQSTIQGINDAFVVATGLTIVALVVSFFFRRVAHGKSAKKKLAEKPAEPIELTDSRGQTARV